MFEPRQQPSPKGATLREAHPALAIGSAVLYGLLGGFMLGTLTNNLGMGLPLGVLLGTTVNAYLEKRQHLQGAGTALAILLCAWAIVGLILMVSWSS